MRKLFSEKLIACKPITIIHPSAFISPSASIGKGSYIAANAVISSNAIVGKGCIINIGVSVGHDAIVGDDCVLNPGVRISSHCRIGARTLFGANSFIFQGKAIGEDCAVDALTYIDRVLKIKSYVLIILGHLKYIKIECIDEQGFSVYSYLPAGRKVYT